MLVYPIGATKSSQYAARTLEKSGIRLTDHPTPEITHLLLDVPSFRSGATLQSGETLNRILERLPQTITVVGGNLECPELSGYCVLDLLRDPEYLAVNASITADCAIRVAANAMETVFQGCPVLILGWGRIGKCLGQMLRAIGADVTIAARKISDLAMLQGLGYQGKEIAHLKPYLSGYQIIFNTVPEIMLDESDLQNCHRCIKIDLASKPGMEGHDVIWARGLPGRMAPISSGALIAQRFLHLTGRT